MHYASPSVGAGLQLPPSSGSLEPHVKFVTLFTESRPTGHECIIHGALIGALAKQTTDGILILPEYGLIRKRF